MVKILREPSLAADQTYDLIIVGGGIYGAMLALLAALQSLRPLLIERGDFGGETSHNSLRILHGGLRYLQTLDWPRFFESVGERHWLLRTFPDLTEALPCLMPLYGDGARRPAVLRVALGMNDLLSASRNQGVRSDCHLPNGQVISPTQVRQRFSQVDQDGLQGGAVWYDGSMPDSQRILMDVLRWASSLGATALNYVEAQSLLNSANQVAGVAAVDRLSGQSYEYRAPVVINAAGPWCQELAAQFDREIPYLFRSSIAWNALLDRPALSEYALAIAPKQPGARTYFLRPWKGRLLAGTVHDPWLDPVQSQPMPTAAQLNACLSDLNEAIPGLELTEREVVRIFSGLLPASESGTAKLAKREVILDHAQQQGPQGLYSVSGVKFTTSRLVAEKTLCRIFPNRTQDLAAKARSLVPPAPLGQKRGDFAYDWYPTLGENVWQAELRDILLQESVQHLDDLILRRTSLGDNPDRALAVAPTVCELFGWDDVRRKAEIARLRDYLAQANPYCDRIPVTP